MGCPLANAYSLRHSKWPSRNSFSLPSYKMGGSFHGFLYVYQAGYHHFGNGFTIIHQLGTGDDSKFQHLFRERATPSSHSTSSPATPDLVSVHTGGKRYPRALTEQGLEKWVIFHRLHHQFICFDMF